MKYYITKYLTTRGIVVLKDTEVDELLSGELRIRANRKLIKHGAWFTNAKDALEKAESIRAKRLYRLAVLQDKLAARDFKAELEAQTIGDPSP